MEVFDRIKERWFLSEPLLFSVLCTHRMVENPKMEIPVRTGKMRVEYNPQLIELLPDEQVAEFLKIEIIRILLKHPYQRQPYRPDPAALGLASDVTIAENYDSILESPKAESYGLPSDLAYEDYYRLFLAGQDGGDSAISPLVLDQAEELAELWGEDNLAEDSINKLIRQAKDSKSWGTLSGDMIEIIEATLMVKLDYRKILNSFRASVLSTHRSLTRMRPSRRYGFQYMGSRFDFCTRLLVAVDVSGSVGSDDLRNFFSVINRFFKYGIKEIDVIQFDAEIQGESISLRHAQKSVKVKGRGGTNFQPVFDYLCEHPNYDGLILFTDGYAPAPTLRRNLASRILWILDCKENFEVHRDWIERMPRASAVWID